MAMPTDFAHALRPALDQLGARLRRTKQPEDRQHAQWVRLALIDATAPPPEPWFYLNLHTLGAQALEERPSGVTIRIYRTQSAHVAVVLGAQSPMSNIAMQDAAILGSLCKQYFHKNITFVALLPSKSLAQIAAAATGMRAITVTPLDGVQEQNIDAAYSTVAEEVSTPVWHDLSTDQTNWILHTWCYQADSP